VDARHKAGHDEKTTQSPVNTSLILFVKMAAFAPAIGRGVAADVVKWLMFRSSVA
jgi:hypothetical protein